MSGWIGVDLDGTLAVHDETFQIDKVGAPIPKMVERVKGWLAEGLEVRIVTARVGEVAGRGNLRQFIEDQEQLISEWCKEHLGQDLIIQAHKDFHMIRLFDDRAVQVETNTGRLIGQEEDS